MGQAQHSTRFIRDMAPIPRNARLLIYGAGGRGDEALDLLRQTRPDVGVLGFLDTYSEGRRQDLPVSRLDDYLSRRQEMEDHAILVASSFYPAILESLEQAGIAGGLVFLKDADPPYVSHLPVAGVTDALAGGRHPLQRPPRTTTPEEGRYWRCHDFASVYFRPSGLSFCCWLPDLTRLGHGPLAALKRLDALRREFCQATDADRHPFCAACPSLAPVSQPELPGGIRTLHIDTSIACNLSCRYCQVKHSGQKLDYDFAAVLQTILDRGMLAASFSYSWGGLGEPTLNPDFEPVTQRLASMGGAGLVYSNCVRFSETLARHVGSTVRLVCSIDAGTPATYAELRQRDAFGRVWENIRRYIAAGGAPQFTAKYIMLPQNSAPRELQGFVQACRDAGVQNVLIARDFYSGAAPREIVRAMGELWRRSRDAGLQPAFLDAAAPAEEQRLALELAGAEE